MFSKIYGFLILEVLYVTVANGLFEFPKVQINISKNDAMKLSQLNDKLEIAVLMGMESLIQQERLETILLDSLITVQNGTVSHAQFLETYPNSVAKQDDRVAKQILKASLYLLNSECKQLGISSQVCSQYLSQISIPESSLKDQCLKITQSHNEGHGAYRRLLPPNYKDSLYEMFKYPKVSRPREITHLGLYSFNDFIKNGNNDKEHSKNLILVQWSQFIEHDVSKMAVTTMLNGAPIECCNTDHFKLTPRYIHPSCAQLEDKINNSFARVPCLNFVRSALAVNTECKFGPAQQLNQATSSLDLSQLYGFTQKSRKNMRTFTDGLLKTSSGDLLPLAENKEKFCVTNDSQSNDPCFMAGDSRVNSNPFVTVLYTIFLRKHNLIAKELKQQFPDLLDEQIYETARKINIHIYRQIIYNEWLPMILGKDIAKIINEEPMIIGERKQFEKGVSNEFAVAAIHFYYSMMPNALYGVQTLYQNLIPKNMIDVSFADKKNELFELQNEFYTSNFLSNPKKLITALEAMLNQHAMKMDPNYAESLTKYYLKTGFSSAKISGIDALAWDIQRGRDHGLAGYIRYLEGCTNAKIEDWVDLEEYINHKEIEKLRAIYNSVNEIDLIVGGISEKPTLSSILGPTFTCIIGEQFSNIRKTQFLSEELYSSNTNENSNLIEKIFNLWKSTNYTGSKLLCETTSLIEVPKNIFMTPSNRNSLDPCLKL